MSRGKGDGKHWVGVSHVKIRNDVLRSKAWAAISPMSRSLYVDLRSWMFTGANGDIEATNKTLSALGYKKSSLSKSLYELQAAGLIAKTRNGGVADGSKVCCLYRFTDFPVIAIPKKGIHASKATYDYLNLEIRVGQPKATTQEVKSKIYEAMEAMKSSAKEKRKKNPRVATQDSKPPVRVATQDSEKPVYPVSQDSENVTKSPESLDGSSFTSGDNDCANEPLSILPNNHLSITNTYKGYDGQKEKRARVVADLLASGQSNLSGVARTFKPTARVIDFSYRPTKHHAHRSALQAAA